MLVKIKKPIKGYGYYGGETVSLPDEDAARLVNEGFAIVIQDTEGEDENVLPEGLPARAILAGNRFHERGTNSVSKRNVRGDRGNRGKNGGKNYQFLRGI